MSLPQLSSRYALFPVRLIIGFGFFAHGIAKLQRGPEKLAVLLQRVGVPLPGVIAWIGTLTEVFGGAALLAWLGVALVCLPLIVIIRVTAAGPQFEPPGYEINLLYIAALLALAVTEPTIFSVDRLFSRAVTSRVR